MANPWLLFDNLPSGPLWYLIEILQFVLIPFRAIVGGIVFVSCYLFIALSTCCMKINPDKPLPKWKADLVRSVTSIHARIILLIMGVFCIDTHDLRTPEEKKAPLPNLIVANHGSYMDVLVASYFMAPGFVAKADVAKAPVVGRLALGLQGIFLDRSSTTSRHATLDLMRARSENPAYPPCLIFPEGTTTNGTCLLQFQAGVFRIGKPVQPIAIKYNWHWVNPNWTAESFLAHFKRFAGRSWFLSVSVFLLSPYHPSDAEVANPILYATNVQNAVAKALDIPVSDQCMYDHPLGHIKKSIPEESKKLK